MISKGASKATIGRLVAISTFAAIVGGLPLALRLTDGGDAISTGSITAYAGDAIAIATPVRISERLPLTLDSGLVSMSDRRGESGARAPAVVTIDEAALTLDVSGSGFLPVRPSGTPDTKPPLMPQIAGFSSGAVRLRGARLTLLGPRGSRALVEDVDATVTVTRRGSYKLVGGGRVNGQQLAIDAIWSDSGARDGAPKLPLRLTVRSAVLEATLDGLFRSGASPSFAGQAQFRLQSLRSFASWIGLGRGFGEQLRSLVVTGPLEWSLSQMSFARTTVDVDGNQASGALSIRHAGERLAIDATLGFKELDFADSLFAARPAASVALPPDTPHVLSLIDADLRLSADKLRAPALELGKAAVSIALRNGRLQADIAELDIEGGAAGGQLAVDLGKPEPVVDVRIKLKGVDAGRLLAAPLKRNPLLGRANVTFEGSTNGRSIRDAFTGLAGRGSFELTEPSRLGLDLQALVHAARASPVVGWSAAGKGSTPLESLNGRFRVIAGAVAIEVMQARTGASVMVGSGRLDIPARLMDLSIATGPAGAGETSVPAQSVLLMRGTWDTPAISLMPAPRPELKVEAPVRTH